VYGAILSGGGENPAFHGQIFVQNMDPDHSCTILGYPGASAWKNGHMVGNPAKWMPAAKQPVVLAPYHKGDDSAVARFDNLGTDRYPAKQCKPVLAKKLRVFVPNSRAGEGPPHIIGWYLKTCSSKVFNLRVWPFKAYHSQA
jgi:hypothetical protein